MTPALHEIDSPPSAVLAGLAGLRDALDNELPEKDTSHLMLGTWNVREFGDLTASYESTARDSPKRNLADICAIAEIVSRFDVCALRETRGNLTGLRTLTRRLGPDWGFVVTAGDDDGGAGHEHLAYLFDLRSVRLSGLDGDLLSTAQGFGAAAIKLKEQFACSPHTVSFETGPPDKPVGFTLMTLHIIFGGSAADRTPELVTFAQRLKQRAQDPDACGGNMIALGDFNIDTWDDGNADAFLAEKLTPPAELLGLPRTIFDIGHRPHHYDQVAWFTVGNREVLTLRYEMHAGRFDWTPYLHTNLTNVAKSWRISDHLPLWTQFALP